MSAANDKTCLQAAARVALMGERDRIARQAENLGEAMRAMQGVRDQMHDRLIAILGELQRRDALSSGTNNGDAR